MCRDNRGKKQSMTDEQIRWLRFNYSREQRPAKVLAEIMGVKCRTLQYYVQKMNLYKTKETKSIIYTENIKKRVYGRQGDE